LSSHPLETVNNFYDLAPDGKRIVGAEVTPSAANAAVRPTHAAVLLNFADELRRPTAAK
jgi:hypothetical protein